MNNHYQYLNPKVCKKHNLPIVLIDQQLNLPTCLTCVQEIKGMVSNDLIKQKQQEIKIIGFKEFQQEEQQFQQLLDSIQNYKENMIKGIDKIIQIIIDQIQNLQKNKESLQQQIMASNQLNKLEQLRNQLKNQEDHHQQVKIQIKQQLTEFQQKFINVDYLKEILKQSNEIIVNQDNQDKRKQKIQIQEMRQENIQKLKKYQYELIEESKMKEDMFCRSFAFNKDDTILIFRCGSMIRIYQFINGKIGKELQVLQNHKDDVICLYCMKKSHSFVSGSSDNLIIIWKFDNKNYQVFYQMLTDHTDTLNCFLMNKNEDLLISGSNDKTVKFWKKDQGKWSCKQTIQVGDYVFSMSLNEMENTLITCGAYPYICIIRFQDNNQWSIKQKIKVNEYGFRVCFTIGDEFVFQPNKGDYIEIFNFDNTSKEFREIKQVQIQKGRDYSLLFPCQFVKSLNILIVQLGKFLNIFRINEDKNYELVQTIKYENYNFFGTVSNDGQHLITWNEDSQQIQVRKLKYMND